MNEQMLIDLENHFARKLRTQIRDIASTCEYAKFDNRETISIVVSALMYEMVRAAAVLKMDEDAFIDMCECAYRTMIKHAKKELKDL